MILLQLLPSVLTLSPCDLVHQCPKTVTVVHLYGVAKFVEEDVVDQVPGQEHQGKRERLMLRRGVQLPQWLLLLKIFTSVQVKPCREARSSNREGKRRRASCRRGLLNEVFQEFFVHVRRRSRSARDRRCAGRHRLISYRS